MWIFRGVSKPTRLSSSFFQTDYDLVGLPCNEHQFDLLLVVEEITQRISGDLKQLDDVFFYLDYAFNGSGDVGDINDMGMVLRSFAWTRLKMVPRLMEETPGFTHSICLDEKITVVLIG